MAQNANLKYTNPSDGILDFCKQKLTAPAMKPTLFSEYSGHENHPNFPKSRGHRPRPRVILILSNIHEYEGCGLFAVADII